MIKEIDITLLKNNKFNPKNPMSESENKILKESLKKWGFQGVLTVCNDYEDKGKYIVIDGNDRIKKIKKKSIDCYIITGIKNDDDLKELTLDFTSAVKNRNYIKLLELYKDVKDRLSESYHQNFNRVKLNIEKYAEDQKKLQMFDKTVLLKFGDKESFNSFETVKKNIKKKIYSNDKFIKHLQTIENEDFIEEKIDKHIIDILMRIAKNG